MLKYLRAFLGLVGVSAPQPAKPGDVSDPVNPLASVDTVHLMGDGTPDGWRRLWPQVIFAKCLAADVVGASVYVTGRDATDNVVTVATTDTALAHMPVIGQIVRKISPTQAVISTDGYEVQYAGLTLTVGKLYVVGTDGLPAKSGAANYPSTNIQPIGVAISTDRLLKLPNLIVPA